MKILTFSIVIVIVHTSSIPPNFRQCFRKDPKFRRCLFEAAQHGISQLTKPYEELDLPNLEPLEVSSLTVPGRDGAVAVNQSFNGCNIHGLTTIKLKNFDLDVENKILEASGTVHNLTFTCRYQLDGKVLLLPVQGDGNSTIVFTDFQANFFALFDEVVREGKTFYKTVYNELTSNVGKVYFQFDNLFNGEKELGDNVNQFLNENWKEIYSDLQPDYNGVIRQILTNILDRMWNKVSLEELFD